MRTIPIPLSPNGVEMAAIVSSSLAEIPNEGVYEEPLFKGFDSFPLFLFGDDRDLLCLTFPKALRSK